MIEPLERNKMLAVSLCGKRVVERLESIGIRRLADMRNRDPWELMHEINCKAGRRVWQPPLAIVALQNLVDAAERADG
jgi:nucleotidyltransferase/DNA polymerase involved in DNA repair